MSSRVGQTRPYPPSTPITWPVMRAFLDADIAYRVRR
jgi:hypothetical protein